MLKCLLPAFGLALTIATIACAGDQAAITTNVDIAVDTTNQQGLTKILTSTPTISKSTTQALLEPHLLLKLVKVPLDLPPYDRDDWKHWVDEDKDCQNTRHEVLIEESLASVTFKSERKCQVATGEWFDPYTGETITNATKLDMDHMVPLKNAHDSGGWAWDKDRKSAFANEMSQEHHLIAVTASANRSKGARGPEKWKPANRDYWCDYATDWVQIKVDWELSATKTEWAALQEMLQTCDVVPAIRPVR